MTRAAVPGTTLLDNIHHSNVLFLSRQPMAEEDFACHESLLIESMCRL